MIIIYHTSGVATRAVHEDGPDISVHGKMPSVMMKIASENRDSLLVWCDERAKDHLNLTAIPEIFTDENIMASFGQGEFIPEAVGYVEESPYLKVNKSVRFPTWRMNTIVGGIHASVLISASTNSHDAFGYFLNSISKSSMPRGLFCYSDPRLLTESKIRQKPASTFELFRFVRQHYRGRWILLLLLNFLIYEKRFPLIAAICSIFYRRRTSAAEIHRPTVNASQDASLDVVIPTIGRAEYLHDLVSDFSNQTRIPRKLIIVEQNPEVGSRSRLGFLSRDWPFEIDHVFTHQPGACNARNLALARISSDWVFLADDDIRLERNFIEKVFENIDQRKRNSYTICCLNPGERQTFDRVMQFPFFGSGCSFVRADAVRDIRFDMAFEFGFNEDLDFGTQLLNNGYDTLYLPEPQILHLKAPIGGFRTKPDLLWKSDPIQPKPSPTVMYFRMKNHTKEQLRGYKTTSFFKFYGVQKVRNPLKYFRIFKQRWSRSEAWAMELGKTSRS